jgi:2-methylcitrate dehydratase
MTQAEKLAAFTVNTRFEQLSSEAVHSLKIRVLDALGCAFGALEAEPIRRLRNYMDQFNGGGGCTLIGGGSASPERAAFYNSALIRYLDFNDSYLAAGETCHPSDNIGAVLAAAEYAEVSGREFLTSLATAYQVQCRLSDVAPVRFRGFDHTTQGSYAVAAGVSRALNLNAQQTMNAIAISGTAFNALRVTRTGRLSNWKGFAYPNTAFGCMHATLLASHGITGPSEVFEGNKGFMDTIAGNFTINWEDENLEKVRATAVKRYNAEIHSQSVLEGLIELRAKSGFSFKDIDHILIQTFKVCYDIIGGGEEGDKKIVSIKEEADHSLPYMVAVACIDGQVLPEQYTDERITKKDVQTLLQKVHIKPSADLSDHFPDAMPCSIEVHMRDGRVLHVSKNDYEGYHTRPMRWGTVVSKFDALTAAVLKLAIRREIVNAVENLDVIHVKGLTDLLNRAERWQAVV